MNKFVLLGLFTILLVGIAQAATNDTALLSLQSSRIKCLMDFHTSVMSDITSKVPQVTDLGDWVTKLQSETSQLDNLAQQGDQKAFHDYVENTLRPDLKSADDAVKADRQGFKSDNISKTDRLTILTLFKSDMNTYGSCVNTTELQVAAAKAQYYSNVLSSSTDDANNLAAKNISIDGLMTVIKDAQDSIVTPLQNAADSNDPSTAKDALSKYCLWDGCDNGTNFHFEAKYDIAKLTTILQVLTPSANDLNLSVDISAVQSKLDAANTALNTTGTGIYKGTEENDVWNNIKGAQNALKTLRNDIKNKINTK